MMKSKLLIIAFFLMFASNGSAQVKEGSTRHATTYL